MKQVEERRSARLVNRVVAKAIVITLSVAIACSAARSVEAVTLNLTPATDEHNKFDIEVKIGLLGDSDASFLTGNIDVDFDYSIINSDAVISGIEFTGGQIAFSDVSFSIFTIQVSGTGIAGIPGTDVVPSPSVVTDTQFNAADHLLTVNQGIFNSSTLPEPIDISTMPIEGRGSGMGTVVTSVSQRSPLSVTYDTTLTYPVAIDSKVNEDPPVRVILDGVIQAVGQWTVDLPFHGDFNGDLTTDAADFTVWRDSLDATGSDLPADANADLVVDQLDYDIWAADFGNVRSAAAATTHSVPEPNCLSVALLLQAMWLGRLGRRTKDHSSDR